MLKRTALYPNHLQQSGKMVDFHGWEMPLHYGSQLNEHHVVRKDAGMFDVSHMNVVDILGAGGRQFLRKLLANDVDSLQHVGRALYSCMCNEHGGILDDLIVYQRAPDNYRLVLNSATKEKDLAWIREKIKGFKADIQERADLAILAVQGPKAIEKLSQILSPSQADSISTLAYFESVEIDDYFFARTGYTGEDGLELIVPQNRIQAVWDKLIAVGVAPCGLAARDSLRLEAGYLLYGQDMNESNSPLDSGLAWTVKWQPEDRDFIGMGALLSQKQQGTTGRFVGLVLEDKGIMRAGQTVLQNGQPVGQISSGSYSPSLEQSIALARISSEVSGPFEVDIRGKACRAKLVKPRFVKNGQSIVEAI